MIWIDALLAIAIALLLGLLLAGVFGWRHPARPEPWPGTLFLFAVLFLAIWAGGAWLTPIGPPMWGASWLSFLLVGAFVALLVLAVSAPVRVPRTREEAAAEAEATAVAGAVFGAFFWALLIGLVIAIIVRYVAVA